MTHASIWESLTLRTQQSLTQYKAEYTFNTVTCGPLLLKIIIRMATMDTRATISIIRAQLNGIEALKAVVTDNMGQITEFFTENLERLKAYGANTDDKVDVLNQQKGGEVH